MCQNEGKSQRSSQRLFLHLLFYICHQRRIKVVPWKYLVFIKQFSIPSCANNLPNEAVFYEYASRFLCDLLLQLHLFQLCFRKYQLCFGIVTYYKSIIKFHIGRVYLGKHHLYFKTCHFNFTLVTCISENYIVEYIIRKPLYTTRWCRVITNNHWLNTSFCYFTRNIHISF